MTKKQFAIGLAIFVAGMIFSPKGGESATVVESPTTDMIPREQVIKLRDTDNKVFALAGSGMTACSDMLQAINDGDVEKLESQTDLVGSISQNIILLGAERDAILTEAGIPNEQ